MFRIVISTLAFSNIALCTCDATCAETEQPRPTIVPAGAGVVAVVDAGGVSDPVSLCQGGRRLVHVLADADADRDRVRSAAREAGLLGLVSAATRPRLDALPYAGHLLDGLVVEDWHSAAARGLTWRAALGAVATRGSVSLRGLGAEAVRAALAKDGLMPAVTGIDERGDWTVVAVGIPPGQAEATHPALVDAGAARFSADLFNGKRNSYDIYYLNPEANLANTREARRAPLHQRFIEGLCRVSGRVPLAGVAIGEGRLLMAGTGEPAVCMPNGTWIPHPGMHLIARSAANGVPLWTAPVRMGQERPAPIAIHAGLALALEIPAKQLRAFDIDTGAERWTAPLPDDLLGQPSEKEPPSIASAPKVPSTPQKKEPPVGCPELVAADGVALVAAAGGATAHRLADGRLLWRSQESVAMGVISAGTVVLGMGEPVHMLSRRSAFSAKVTGLSARKALDGKGLWSRSTADIVGDVNNEAVIRSAVLVGATAGFVVVLVQEKFVVLLDTATGRQRYRISLPDVPRGKKGDIAYSDIGLLADRVVVCGPDVRVISLADGSVSVVDPAPLNRAYGNWPCGARVLTKGMVEALGKEKGPVAWHERLGNLPVGASCTSSAVPAYNSAYQPQSYCGCYGYRLPGFVAATPFEPAPPSDAFTTPPALEVGPAYKQAAGVTPSGWATYRADPTRACAAGPAAPSRVGWRADVVGKPLPAQAAIPAWSWRMCYLYAGPVSAPVVAGGTVLVAVPQRHQIVALDAADGRERWRFTADGPIDGPPTLYAGRVIFGCRDGRVYCLESAGGQLAWRRRIAPMDRLVQVYGQLESVYPVCGPVLVKDGLIHASAGLSGQVGIQACVLDALSGEVKAYGQLPHGFYHNDTPVLAPDGTVRLACIPFSDAGKPPLPPRPAKGPGIIQPPRFAEASKGMSWLCGVSNQIQWTLGTQMPVGQAYDKVPAGILPIQQPHKRNKLFMLQLGPYPGLNWAWNEQVAIGLGTRSSTTRLGTALCQATDVRLGALFAIDRGQTVDKDKACPRWQADLGEIWAIAIAGGSVITIQPKREADSPNADPLLGPGLLRRLALADGNELGAMDLPSCPVQDGLAIADGKVYVSVADGAVLCLTP